MTFDEKNQIVILKDASFIDVFALIEFIYKGEVNIGQVSIISFYFILDFNNRHGIFYSFVVFCIILNKISHFIGSTSISSKNG